MRAAPACEGPSQNALIRPPLAPPSSVGYADTFSRQAGEGTA